MNSNILVSVIIPAHGHAGMTSHCVDKVLETTAHRNDVEILVVDDASPKPIELRSANAPPVRLLRSEANLRFSRACNFGAKAAQGRYLLFLNNDTEPKPGWLDALVGCAESGDEIGVVGARLLYRDGTVQHAGVAFSQRDGVPRHVYRGFPGEHPVAVRDRDFQAVTAACVLFRRSAFEHVGGFDAEYVNGYEDIDLCLRVREAGYRVRYCGGAVVFHFESVSRRGEVEGLVPEADSNLQLFSERWLRKAHRDELNVYADDGLLWVDSGEIYPLAMRCSEDLAVVGDINDRASIASLLNVRSHQVFDLEKDIGYLTSKLLDHGIEP